MLLDYARFVEVSRSVVLGLLLLEVRGLLGMVLKVLFVFMIRMIF